MSRSIHTTRRSLAALRARKFDDKAAKEAAIAEAKAALRRKRRIKRQVKDERRAKLPTGSRTRPESVAVRIEDSAPHVYNALSEDDVRSVLTLLPAAATHGISEVRLSLGREYMAEWAKEYPGEPDPYVGRLGSAMFPGGHSGTILGTYFPERGAIAVYAYVVDPRQWPAPREICELFLRLQALKTLVHEIAHFHDETARVRRGRWLADRHENSEWYAEKMEHEWTGEAIARHLAERYGPECRRFEAWLLAHGGIALPVTFFAGDPRRTERDKTRWSKASTADVFEAWLASLPECHSAEESQLSLARELHAAELMAECLAILDRLSTKPEASKAVRVLRADTLTGVGRHDEALAEADAVLASDPRADEAWKVRAAVFEAKRDWPKLIENGTRWLALGAASARVSRVQWLYKAVGFCALGQFDKMEECFAELSRLIRPGDSPAGQPPLTGLRRAVYFRSGREKFGNGGTPK